MNRSVSGGDVTESLGINNDDNVSSARSVDFLLPQGIHNIPTGAPSPRLSRRTPLRDRKSRLIDLFQAMASEAPDAGNWLRDLGRRRVDDHLCQQQDRTCSTLGQATGRV